MRWQIVVLRWKQIAMTVLRRGAAESADDESVIGDEESEEEESYRDGAEVEFGEYIRSLREKYEVPESFVVGDDR